ncbi:MAG: hypothetical protein VXW22_13560, partial [Pseudomonadota bacterium]|nr:hypothetical protein [Pseudomonadota bacterium]
MFAGQAPFLGTELDMSERTRTHAYWIGVLGLCFAAFVYSVYFVSGKDTALVRIVIPTYTVILGTITLSAHKDFYV